MSNAPWFEDFSVGDDLSQVPSVTLTDGYAAVHQAMFADRYRPAIDAPLSARLTRDNRLLANPSLVCNIAIGASTVPTQRVLGNLFYRGLRFHRPVFIGDTLTTQTKVLALRQNTIKPGRAASGMVGLEIHTVNQKGETVLLFWRCPMVPCRDSDANTGHADDLSVMPEVISKKDVLASIPDWNYSVLPVETINFYPGEVIDVEARDTVTMAPELVRMSLNMAMTHTDVSRSVYDKRLVYGGHTISMAASQLARILPSLAMIVCWYKCDHVAPVFEEDILSSRIHVKEVNDVAGGRLMKLAIDVFAERVDTSGGTQSNIRVLDWQLAVMTGPK